MPRPVRATRVLLLVAAGLTLVAASQAWLLVGGAYGLGAALVVALPGFASVLVGVRIRRKPTRWLWIGLIVLEVLYLLWQFGRIGAGDPFGLLGLGFPIAILVLVCRASSRRYFRGDHR
jgi:hypothetical protein